MKIICDCGNEVEFIIREGERNFAKYDWKKFEIHTEHDELWIKCCKCNKEIWSFT